MVSVQTQSERASVFNAPWTCRCSPGAQLLTSVFPRRLLLFSFRPLSADGWAKWQIAPCARSPCGFGCQAFKRHRPPAPLQEWIPFKALAVFWLFSLSFSRHDRFSSATPINTVDIVSWYLGKKTKEQKSKAPVFVVWFKNKPKLWTNNAKRVYLFIFYNSYE